MKAKIVRTKRLLDKFFKIDEVTIRHDKHDGGEMTVRRLVLERGHAVAILPYDPKLDKVLLVNEMRPGMLYAGDNPFHDSLSAGMIDKGETLLQAAKRELFEETGLKGENFKVIHPGAYVSSGGTSETIALVFCTVDSSKAGGVHGHASEGEDIKSAVISSKEFMRRAETGELKDLKSLAGAFWLALNKKEIQKAYAASSRANDNAGKKRKIPKRR